MSNESNETPSITYKTDDGLYDVLKLNQDAQGYYSVIVECTNEVKALRKRIAVLEAATAHFNSQITPYLEDDALIDEE